MLLDTDLRCDVMQVCRNGHVITDRLRSQRETGRTHCDRCGATTLSRCPTCGTPLPGAPSMAGFEAVGRCRPPDFCMGCGRAFPWTETQGPPTPVDLLAMMETLLRRVPQVVRALRTRHGTRPAFRIEDDHDLTDLLRGLLFLHFEDVRPRWRTPSYSACTRTDLWLLPDRVALVAKCCTAASQETQLDRQWQEDLSDYAERSDRVALVGLVYDPERRIANPASWERAWSAPRQDLAVRGLIVS